MNAQAGKKSSKKGQKVTILEPSWDMGSEGLANRHGMKREPAVEVDASTGKSVNPNNVSRCRRLEPIDVYLARGWIDAGQHNMAKRLREAYEGTQRGPEAIQKVQVDSTPDHGARVVADVEAIMKLVSLTKYLPSETLNVVEHVIYRGRMLEDGFSRGPMETVNDAARLSFALCNLREQLQ